MRRRLEIAGLVCDMQWCLQMTLLDIPAGDFLDEGLPYWSNPSSDAAKNLV